MGTNSEPTLFTQAFTTLHEFFGVALDLAVFILVLVEGKEDCDELFKALLAGSVLMFLFRGIAFGVVQNFDTAKAMLLYPIFSFLVMLIGITVSGWGLEKDNCPKLKDPLYILTANTVLHLLLFIPAYAFLYADGQRFVKSVYG